MGQRADRASALRRAGAIAARQANKLGVGAWRSSPARSTRRRSRSRRDRVSPPARGTSRRLKTAPPRRRASARRSSAATILAADASARERRHSRGPGDRRRAALARRLGMLPGQRLHAGLPRRAPPATSRQRHGMKVTVLGRAEMEREKMGSFLCVAQGTHAGAQARSCIEYRKGAKDAQADRARRARGSASIRAASPSSPRRAWSG